MPNIIEERTARYTTPFESDKLKKIIETVGVSCLMIGLLGSVGGFACTIAALLGAPNTIILPVLIPCAVMTVGGGITGSFFISILINPVDYN